MTRTMEQVGTGLEKIVADWGWRAELQELAPSYLAVINRYVVESVKRIEFVIADQATGEGARAAQTTQT